MAEQGFFVGSCSESALAPVGAALCRERAAKQPQDLSVDAEIAGAAARPFPAGPTPRQGRSYRGGGAGHQMMRPSSRARSSLMAMNFDVGVWLPSPMLSSGTRGFTSG